MTREQIKNDYFNWLYNIVCGIRHAEQISYRKLLMYLHGIDFHYTILRDQNRAQDGIDLRRRFGLVHDLDGDVDRIVEDLEGPCSVLEMMVALAIRCEETIMDDASIGDRTGQWFWEMVVSLGLGYMTDDRFDRRLADEVIHTFLDRKYEPNGKGGLFTIRHCDRNLRSVEIWVQMCWYLDTIV